MKTLKLLFYFVFVLTITSGCFAKKMSHLSWNHIENKNITNFEYSVDSELKDTAILTAKTETFSLKIFERTVTAENFPGYADNIMNLLNSYYKEFESPYPGSVSEKIVCTENMKPRRLANITNDNLIGEASLLYANNRYAYGECDPELTPFESLQAIFHCKKSKTTYEAKYVIKKSSTSTEELKTIFSTFSCI